MTAQGYRPNQMYEITTPAGVVHKPPKGRCWSMTRPEYEKLLAQGRIWFGSDNRGQPNVIRYLSEIEGFVPWTWWPHTEAGHTDEAKKEIYSLLGKDDSFDTPKPVRLIVRTLQIATNPDTEDLILDFFAGSSTTAQAVLELNREDAGNRKFIMVQLPEPTGSLNYPTIAEIGKERIRRVIKKLNEEDESKLKVEDEPPQDRGFKVFKLTSSNFKIWDGTEDATNTEDELAEQLRAFANNVKPDRSREEILYEILLKAGFPVTAPVETIEVASEEVYAVEEGALLVCLAESVDEKLLRGMVELEPVRVVCLDTAFYGNDRLKTNAMLEMKDRGIEFRTV